MLSLLPAAMLDDVQSAVLYMKIFSMNRDFFWSLLLLRLLMEQGISDVWVRKNLDEGHDKSLDEKLLRNISFIWGGA